MAAVVDSNYPDLHDFFHLGSGAHRAESWILRVVGFNDVRTFR